MYVLQCGCYMLDSLYRFRFWQRTTAHPINLGD